MMTPDDKLKELSLTEKISEDHFYRLIEEFKTEYLIGLKYNERVALHRNPNEVRNEVLRQVDDYFQTMQRRKTMQDIDEDKKVSGYVNVVVGDIWKADKRLKSLYNAVNAYCDLRSREFNVIAIHIAEYRAMVRIRRKIFRDISRSNTRSSSPGKHFQAMGSLNIINPEPFIRAFQDVDCGKSRIAELSSKDFEIKQFETKPLDGFELPSGFPLCCGNHKKLFQIGVETFEKFPNCCDSHKKLLQVPWFRKENYSYLPNKFVTTLTYTWNCILKCINNKDWFKEITDYIDYTKASYGQFPDGYGGQFGLNLYLYNLQKNIEDAEDIPSVKKERLISFLENYNKPDEEVEPTEINLLITKYEEWLKIFPFELSLFKNLKPIFQKQIPIIKGRGETNIYTGMTGFKLQTKKELIGFLSSVTYKIIQEINAAELYNKGLLTNSDDLQKQVIVARRKLQIEELDKTEWKDRKGYIKLLKKWLKGEKAFLSEITPILNKEDNIALFIKNLIDGIKELQSSDTNADCIVNVRDNKPDKETAFRYWFKTFFAGRYPDATISAEEEKGKGRIDLKISHKSFGSKIVEFKGWWNQDKKKLPEQLCSYLTDFEREGYIFMINHSNKDITDDYRELIVQGAMNFVTDTWREHKILNTDLSYYESKHKFSIKEKMIYHFIFNVNFSNQLLRK